MIDQRAMGTRARMLIESVDAPPVDDAISFVGPAPAGLACAAPVSASPVGEGPVVLKSE